MSDVKPEDFEDLHAYDKLRSLKFEHTDCLELLQLLPGLDDRQVFRVLYITARKHWDAEVAAKYSNKYLDYHRGLVD